MNRNGTSKKPEMFSKVLKWNLKQTGKWKGTGKKLKEELNFEPVFSKKNQIISSPISDGSSPKKSIPGRSRALNIDLEPSPSPGPSQMFDPAP